MPSTDVLWAREVISGKPLGKIEDVITHAKALKGENRFDLARRVLALAGAGIAPGHPRDLFVHQQIANCTYKDEDLPMPHRFYVALQVLREQCALDTTRDCETLGLGGAVFKRLWEYGGQRTHLETSLALYHKAYAQRPDDGGYTGINTAFVLDLLAAQESETIDGIAPDVPSQRFAEAEQIRTTLYRALSASPGKPSWWLCATIAEAALGIGKFAEAEYWLKRGRTLQPPRWEFDSTARQLAALAAIQAKRRKSDAWRAGAEAVMENGLGLTQQAVRSVVLGKVGLALSGGGMRAALFHIGMLAKLAELDVLRHVEVLSCVSGGSIIGAFYYLELKKRLESQPSLSQADYIDIVQTVEREFIRGVQKNVRTRIATSPWHSLKMAVVPGYSRSTRAGELYESALYKRVDGIRKRELRSIAIQPYGTTQFNPKYDNWSREAKVPILVLNATTLNTGHNWQFTATWMGESPQAINGAVDAIPRLRRMYIDGRDDIPERFRKFRLGHAVAASAGVPGIFEPIVMRKVYPDRAVRLVDGGVHDNQGLASLIEQSCSIMLVSDASGQMAEAQNPGGGLLSVAGRANGILQARVREAQFNELQTLRRSGAIDGAMFIHLTKDLEADAISFAGADDIDEKRQQPPRRTQYDVDRNVQTQLAAIRTDLDSFSDAESYALMMSAYLMTERAFLHEHCAPTLPLQPTTADWDFLRVRDALTSPDCDDNKRMHRLLEVSSKLATKAWHQSSILGGTAIAALALAAGALVMLLRREWTHLPLQRTAARLGSLTVRDLTFVLLAIGLVVGVRFALDKWLHWQKRFGELLLGVALMTLGFAASWLHLIVFDQIFLWIGRWPAKPQAAPPAIAIPGSPHIPVKQPRPAAPINKEWTPVVRRILNWISN
jgi:predicted acylesterase/phospholipase RssA